jgi:hypothetical protein
MIAVFVCTELVLEVYEEVYNYGEFKALDGF